MIKNYYAKKVEICKYLSGLNAKKVTDSHIISAAEKFDVPVATARRAWKTFQETGGIVDKRGVKKNNTPFCERKTFPIYTKMRTVLPKDAASAILEYMTTKKKSVEICNEYKVVPHQFYEWINEIQVKGTLLGKPVLNHKKYAKIEVLDAIRIVKFPNTCKKSITELNDLERAAYERVGTVLQKYLSAIVEG